MPNLPSKYSDEGLSENDSKKIITTGIRRVSNGAKSDFKVNILLPTIVPSEPQQLERDDDDITMVGTEDFDEVDHITRLVTTERLGYEMDKDTPISILDDSNSSPPSQKLIFLVIDTNFILSHLDILDKMLKLYVRNGSSYQLIIPRTTIQELDGLKNNNKVPDGIISDQSISQLARSANDWCYRNLASSNPLIRGQKFNERLDHSTKKDESILDCCLYFQQKFPKHLVILLSNDKNFCVKLLTNGVLTISYREGMNADLIVRTIIQENINRGNSLKTNDQVEDFEKMEVEQEVVATPTANDIKLKFLIQVQNFDEGCSIIYDEVLRLVISLVDKVMLEEYGDDLDMINYETPSSYKQVFELIIEQWVLVFKRRIASVNFKLRFSQGNNRLNLASITEFIDLPIGPHSLQAFLSFWEDILTDLYLKKSERDKEALKIFSNRWNNILSQIV